MAPWKNGEGLLNRSIEESINLSPTCSLYIHIPFCRSKCDYCAFYSEEHASVDTISLFVKTIKEELTELTSYMTKPFETIFIGGGNPGILSIDELLSIIDIAQYRGTPQEFTMEINPESLTNDHILLLQAGIGRVSMGIQSLHEKHLHTLGRRASLSQSLSSLDRAQKMFELTNTTWNIDLMTCICGQTIQESCSDIETIIQQYHPHHISLYNVTFEERTVLTQKLTHGDIIALDDEAEASMLQASWDLLSSYGYDHYEVSNFAITPSYHSLHNTRYWNLLPYIGIGPSAVSTLGSRPLLRSEQEPHVMNYIHDRHSGRSIEYLSIREEMSEYVMVALRCSEGINKQQFFIRFGIGFDDLFGPTIASLEMNTSFLFTHTPTRFALTEQGFFLLDSILMYLLEAIDRS